MMGRPRLLDLYCGAGGAACGYQQAGFDVTGVDNRPQPRYAGDRFIQADALEVLRGFINGATVSDLSGRPISMSTVDAIHASPPCQRFTALAGMYRPAADMHPDLLTPTLALLADVGIPWVVENVPGAPLRSDIVLCGEMFGLKVRRHRWFQTSPMLYQLMPRCRHATSPVGVYGHPGGTATRDYRRVQPGRSSELSARRAQLADWKVAMGIDWMTAAELSQAIPPAYTRHIGQLLVDNYNLVCGNETGPRVVADRLCDRRRIRDATGDGAATNQGWMAAANPDRELARGGIDER